MIKNHLQKVYLSITLPLQKLFDQASIDQNTLQELEALLIKADVGITTTKKISEKIKQEYQNKKLNTGADLLKILQQELNQILMLQASSITESSIFLMVGINGSGKTTSIAKLVHLFQTTNQSCIVAAADTFRAAAQEQLATWTTKAGCTLIQGQANQDPASVVFQACAAFKAHNANKLIIDTAGRLQNKEHLMQELAKIKRIITKQLPDHKICTLLTIDSTLGQNSLDQAKMFHELMHIDGVILTKMDSSSKGGIIFAIADQLKIPTLFISFGEQITDLKAFVASDYTQELLHS